MLSQKNIDGQVSDCKGKEDSAATAAGEGGKNKEDRDIKVLENGSLHTVNRIRELFIE